MRQKKGLRTIKWRKLTRNTGFAIFGLGLVWMLLILNLPAIFPYSDSFGILMGVGIAIAALTTIGLDQGSFESSADADYDWPMDSHITYVPLDGDTDD